jgi:hypothetical protein
MQFSLFLQSKQAKYHSKVNQFYQRRIYVQNGSIEKLLLLPKLSSLEIILAWIPDSIAILRLNSFKDHQHLLWISFESNSQLTRIESEAFSFSSLQSIVIPSTVQILGLRCFSSCQSLSSISFESNSQLTRIESDAFCRSSLQSIIIPSTVQILGSSCFSSCQSLSSISFESNSQLTRIESNAFSSSSLQSILIPSTVQILGSSCFSSCESLSSISFIHPSQLKTIESLPFDRQNFVVMIPSTIRFVGFDAIPNHFQISIADGDFCVEFDRWQQLRESGIFVDFRRILRIDSDFHGQNDYQIDLSAFEERSVLDELDGNLSEIYERNEDGSLVIVNSKNGFDSKESLAVEIENLLNLFHPCILSPIGFIFGQDSTISGELKIVGLYSEGISLSEVISENPVWWTATAKAKAVAGIVLGLRFAHSLGLIHGHLNSTNIRFDMDHRIQIADFCRIGREAGESEKDREILSGERWSPYLDVRGFGLILFEIIVGHPMMLSGVANNQITLPSDVPMFVSNLIEAGQSSGCRQSFNGIFNVLKNYDFRIMSGVDLGDVLTFISWVESFESSLQ